MKRVLSGLDCWLDGQADAAPIRDGARIGLLAHPASVDAQADHAAGRILASGRFRLERLFAPEHGLFGHEQDMERVGSAVDPASGLHVVSLYGDDAASLRPEQADLDGLDAIVCDLQDVGSRYYTYVYTLSYVMEAARDAGVRVVVLDRPNPIGGLEVQGPVLVPELASFVGRYALPVRHGMTVGELAQLFNEEFGIGCELSVVHLRGWKRSMQFEQTGLPWVGPSPNMPTPLTARVYPGGCLVEGTNLSEGRGTTAPFELVGAPWIDGAKLVSGMRAGGLPGVLFRAASFRPMFQKHAGLHCGGVQVIVSDAGTFRPFSTYLVLLREAMRLAPESFGWREQAYEFETERLAIDLLLGRPDLRSLIENAAPLEAMEQSWADGLEAFIDLRRGYLLYD